MLSNNSTEYPRLRLFGQVLRLFEFILIGSSLVLAGWIGLEAVCEQGVCKPVSIESELFSQILFWMFIFLGVVNSLRIGLYYYLTDPDEIPEYFFYTSLIALAINYILIGIFYQEISLIGLKKQNPTPAFYFQNLIFITALTAFFGEPDIWKKADYHVKIRTCLSFSHICLLFVNPPIGLFIGLLLMLFMPITPVRIIEEEQLN